MRRSTFPPILLLASSVVAGSCDEGPFAHHDRYEPATELTMRPEAVITVRIRASFKNQSVSRALVSTPTP